MSEKIICFKTIIKFSKEIMPLSDFSYSGNKYLTYTGFGYYQDAILKHPDTNNALKIINTYSSLKKQDVPFKKRCSNADDEKSGAFKIIFYQKATKDNFKKVKQKISELEMDLSYGTKITVRKSLFSF